MPSERAGHANICLNDAEYSLKREGSPCGTRTKMPIQSNIRYFTPLIHLETFPNMDIVCWNNEVGLLKPQPSGWNWQLMFPS